MPKDYAYRGRNKQKWEKPHKAKQKKPSGFLRTKRASHLKTPPKEKRSFPWIAMLLVIGLLATLTAIIIYVQHHIKLQPNKPIDKIGAIIKTAKPVRAITSKTETMEKMQPQVKFDFYTTLPKMQIAVADETIAKAEMIPDKHVQYLLQLTSLPNKIDAKAYQNKLRTLGINTKIFTAQHGAIIWYRVEMGPFHKKADALSAKKTLQKQNIDSILLKIHLEK